MWLSTEKSSPYYSELPHTGTVIFFEGFIKIHLKLCDKLTHSQLLGEHLFLHGPNLDLLQNWIRLLKPLLC